MAKLTKEIYLQYAKKIVAVLHDDTFFAQYKRRVDEGAANFKLVKKRLIQDISIDWIKTIEDCLPNLDVIVRNPRKFIVQEEDIVDVSLAKSISTESVKHLAQHTNMISKVDEDGTVTPSRILNITKEESFEIYENRFLYTLLLKLKDFVTTRYDKIKKASATQDVLQLNIDSKFNLPSKKITYRTEFLAQLSFDEVMRLDPDTLDKIERVAKIDRIITDFLSSTFAKQMRGSAPVRPPITRTNVILKEPNFKKALTLWQFVETYQQTAGFASSDDIENYDIPDHSAKELRDMVTLNTMLFESLYDQHETDMDMSDAEFVDLLKAGMLDFAKDEIEHDEFSQKLDEELEKEAEKEEEVKPPEDEKEEEEQKEEEAPPEPEPEIEQEEIDKDVEVDTPPKEEPEDQEPDADEFDKNLFDIRKLYKRPDDDKLKQEEIARIKDAIDRCLTSYRKIKQDEYDEKVRKEAQRRRDEELEKRAAAFKKQREEIERDNPSAGQMYLGTDAFAAHAAKIILPQKDVDFAKEHKDLFINRNERLELSDNDLEQIRKSIEEMERTKHKAEEHRIRMSGQSEGEEEPVAVLPLADLQVADKKPVKKAAKKSGDDIAPALNEQETYLDENADAGIAPVAKKPRTFSLIDENKVGVGDLPVHMLSGNDLLGGSYFGYGKANIVVDKRAAETAEKAASPKVKPAQKAGTRLARKPAEVKPVEVEAVKEDVTDIAEDKSKEKADGEIVKIQLNSVSNDKAMSEDVKKQVPKAASNKKKAQIVDTDEAASAETVAATPVEAKPNIRKAAADPFDPWSLSATTINQKYSKPTGKKKDLTAVDEEKVKVGDINIKEDEIDPYAELEELKKAEKKKTSAKNASKKGTSGAEKVAADKQNLTDDQK